MDPREVRLGLLDGDPTLQPSDSVQIPTARVLGVRLQGRPKIDIRRENRLFRKHSDHRIGLAVDLQDPSQNFRVTRKSALPEPVTEHCNFWAFGLVFVRSEVAAQGGPQGQHVQQIVGHLCGANTFSVASGNGQGAAPGVEERHSLESLIALSPGIEVGIRDAHELEIPFRSRLIQVHQALGVGER